MLWKHYVFRRGAEIHSLWDSLFERRRSRLLYIAGRGFDLRAQATMNAFVENLRESGHCIESAKLLLVGFSGYELGDELDHLTEENARVLAETFSAIGACSSVSMAPAEGPEDDLSASTALRLGSEKVLAEVRDQTDIVLDISSLPRVAYLALITSLLQKLVPDRSAKDPLAAGDVNFQVLVAEDAALDAQIRSEDPSNDLTVIPGFSTALHAESVQDWPLVWFPILGENRVNQLDRIMRADIPRNAEICPVLPHPSRDPRRADRLLLEYKVPLFDAQETPTANVLYAHESHPFEAYRQLLKAMTRYRDSLRVIGGCRVVVTPLGSKLITLGAALASFEMRPADPTDNYGVAISYAEPKRYVVPIESLRSSQPEISATLLTGSAYGS